MVSEKLCRKTFKDGYLMEIKLGQKSTIINFRALTLSHQVKKFPVHVVISVLGIVNEVFRSGEPVFIQQLTAFLPYLVRLTSALLFETFDMAIISLRESKIFVAVSDHGMVCPHSMSALTYLTFALMISDCEPHNTSGKYEK